MKLIFKALFVILAILTSQVSVFADQFVQVNQNASATVNLNCDVIQSPTDSGYIFTWFQNGNEVILDTNQNSILSSMLTKGEIWTCKVYKETGIAGTVFIGEDSTTIRNSAPVITPSNALPIALNGAPGTPFSYDVNATDADADSLTYSLSAITPAAPILINSNTGLLTWFNPVAGIYAFSVIVSDSGYGATSVTQNYNLVISGTAPTPLSVVVSGNPISGPVPLAVAFTATASGGTAPYTYNWDFTNDGTYDANNVSSTSVQNNNVYSATSSYTARVQVTDSASMTAQATVTISVTTTTNTSITFSTSSCPDAEEDSAYTCDIDATGSGTLQYSLLSEPSGMTIDQNSGLISWTPSSAGDNTFTVRVTDITNLLSRDQSFTVAVDEAEVTNEFVFIDSIVFEKETYSPGETAVAYVTVRNEDDNDVDDLKIELLMVDSGVTAVSSEFDLMGNGKKTIKVSFDLPNELFASSEWIKFTLIGENIRIARYRALEFSGASNVFSAKSGPSELIFKPTSLPGYSAGNGVNDLNWSGIWFMIISILLLLGLAAYIVKGMADERKKKVKFTSLDEQLLY